MIAKVSVLQRALDFCSLFRLQSRSHKMRRRPRRKPSARRRRGRGTRQRKSALFRSKVVFKVIRRRWAESLPPFFNSKLSLHVRFDAALCRAQRTGSSQRLNMILFAVPAFPWNCSKPLGRC